MRIFATLFTLCMTMTAIVVSPLRAADAREPSEAQTHIKFMECRSRLREEPKGREALGCLFAVGEYYFRQKNASQAADYFLMFQQETSSGLEHLLAVAYLLRCAYLNEDLDAASKFETQLQDSLSVSPFFSAFGNTRTQRWISPLGNRFDFREEVDRLEITINDKPFYTINIS